MARSIRRSLLGGIIGFIVIALFMPMITLINGMSSQASKK